VSDVSEPTSIPASRAAAWLARGVTATWWYTASSVIFFLLVTLFVWAVPAVLFPVAWSREVTAVVFGIGAALALGGGIPLLLSYRRRVSIDAARSQSSAATVLELVAIVVGGAVLGVATGSLLLPAACVVFGLSLLTWIPGVRLRLIGGLTVLLIVLWVVQGQLYTTAGSAEVVLVHPFFAVSLPLATVASLWWWDVVLELDRARAAESRLAAVQERLRLAGDLHDLQGHHLQVIALQLELAERMLPRDPDAAAEQVRLARASVDEARQGTRELAGRFRGVPLPDELANAADLLRAAGLRVDLDVDPAAAEAPVDVLGPVIRESTTNVLKHGGGKWATLSLARDDGGWMLRVANDCGPEPSVVGSGAGLAGIGDRVRAVGGDLRTNQGEDFEVVVTVPEGVNA